MYMYVVTWTDSTPHIRLPLYYMYYVEETATCGELEVGLFEEV